MTPLLSRLKQALQEPAARWLVLGLSIGLPLALLLARWLPLAGPGSQVIEIRARMPESGGWTPTDLTAKVGEPLHLRLVSDDVVHGFAVGGDPGAGEFTALDLPPGKVVETTLVFNRPGKYTFYCTRWCGVNHWRMRGTIEVSGDASEAPPAPSGPPLYARLGLDIDAPHPAQNIPERTPSASRGEALGVQIPPAYLEPEYYRTHSPDQAWQALRLEPFSQGLSDQEVWDMVAWVWRSNTTPERLAEGQELYAQNCAACHGEAGAGDGVMAEALAGADPGAVTGVEPDAPGHSTMDGHSTVAPTDFTHVAEMLGASPAVFEGKIIRGGMGTGMPYWGPIFTEDQVWALVDYLWTFQFE